MNKYNFFGSGGMEEKSLYYYHSDHLGSTSYVTDRDGKVSQFVAYLPFGESLYEQHSNTKDMPYLFNGKERDEETGLYYYGARYYDPWSAVWAGVDPMWVKYPYQSPYAYCGNNPIMIIDPDGRDEWDLNAKGDLTKRENGRTDIDVVHAISRDGKQVSREFEAGSINNNSKEYSNVVYEGTDDEFSYTTNQMEFSNSNTATSFFEFAAEHTNVEWGLKISENESYVGTSHMEGFVGMDVPKDMTISVHSHIEKYADDYGLRSDHNNARINAAKGVTYKVYLQGTGTYATYNADLKGLYDREPAKTLSSIIDKK